MPQFNDNQIEKIAEFLNSLKHIIKVRILPYHNYAGSKYASLDMENTLPESLPSENEIQKAKDLFRELSPINLL